jgi:hypothetical protein
VWIGVLHNINSTTLQCTHMGNGPGAVVEQAAVDPGIIIHVQLDIPEIYQSCWVTGNSVTQATGPVDKHSVH